MASITSQALSAAEQAQQMQQVLEQAQCLVSEEQVEQAIIRMGEQLSQDLASANPVFVCLMNGGLYLMGRLMAQLDFPLQCDYVHASRYGDALSGQDELLWKVAPSADLTGRVVVLVDDILDQGVTLAEVKAACLRQGAQTVYSCVLVEKQHQRKLVDIKAEYCALEVEDKYIFGCGMDYQGYWRNLSAIYAI